MWWVGVGGNETWRGGQRGRGGRTAEGLGGGGRVREVRARLAVVEAVEGGGVNEIFEQGNLLREREGGARVAVRSLGRET